MKFTGRMTVGAALLVAAALTFTGCPGASADDDEPVGLLKIDQRGGIAKADISITGYDMKTVSKADADFSKTAVGNDVVIDYIPAGKNRVVSISAQKTIANILNRSDGAVLRSVFDVESGQTTEITADWSKDAAVANVFYELISLGSYAAVTGLSAETVKGYLPTGTVPAGLIDAKAIARAIKSGTKAPSGAYTLKSGAVTFTPSLTSKNIKIYVNDRVSKELVGITAGKEERISGVAPGSWTLYAVYDGAVLYEKNVTVKSDTPTELGKITIALPSPVLEDASGVGIDNCGLAAGSSKTVYLRCHTLYEESPFEADIYYTTDGKTPTTSSARYDGDAGISVGIHTNLKAIAVKGRMQSPVAAYKFTEATVGVIHPAEGPFSPVKEDSWGGARWPLGAHIDGDTTTFALYSANATKVLLEIYDAAYGKDARYDYWMVQGSDNVWRAKLKSNLAGHIYAYRCWGPNWPYDTQWKRGGSSAGFISDVDNEGNRFNPNKILFDPYGREMTHDKSNATATEGAGSGVYASGEANREKDSGRHAPKGYIVEESKYNGIASPKLSAEEAIIYEAHVRGITKHPSAANLKTILHNFQGFANVVDIPADKQGTYAGAALLAPYLKALGITTIELLPVHETDNDVNPDDGPGGNYWGYMTFGFFAPERRYSSDKSAGGPTREFKEMVSAFHEQGMEVYLDVVYNHTGEGGLWDLGATTINGKKEKDTTKADILSMRGIDNRTYYCFADPRYYWETSGCGNNLRCDNPIARALILDSLRYWVEDMGVDGFRFDIAVILGREYDAAGKEWNFNPNAKTLRDIEELGRSLNVEMIAEGWDLGRHPTNYQVGNFPYGWGGWNGRFRDSMRAYIGGGEPHTSREGEVTNYINGDYSNFNKEGGPHKSINFLVAHDGSTLTDLCCYAGKGNKFNKELPWPFGPSDGGVEDWNTLKYGSAWRTMTEEERNKRGLLFVATPQERRQTARNYFAVQMMSRGTPMIVWGDELCRTQNGNNNPYNIDSVATWNNYNMIDTNAPHAVATGGIGASYNDMFGKFTNTENKNGNFIFAQYMMNLRKNEKVLQQANYNVSYDFRKVDGYSGLWRDDRAIWVRINGSSAGGHDYLMFMNMWIEKIDFSIPADKTWKRLVDTHSWAETEHNCWAPDKAEVMKGNSYGVNPWSVVILRAD